MGGGHSREDDLPGRAVEVWRAQQRFHTRTDWLESAHSFSFGAHYHPDNVAFGRLMVSNHEILTIGSGFDDHPHADAEIVTWVLSGSLVHADSAGHRGVVHRGLAQRMSAGRGIVHAERNDAFRIDPGAPPTPVEYVQMWVRPDEPGGDPSYQQADFTEGALAHGWLPVASGREESLIRIGSAATLWATVLGPGVSRAVPEAAQVHLYVARGRCRLVVPGRPAGLELAAGDAVRLTRVGGVVVNGSTRAGLSLAGLPVPGQPVPGLLVAELLVWQMDG